MHPRSGLVAVVGVAAVALAAWLSTLDPSGDDRPVEQRDDAARDHAAERELVAGEEIAASPAVAPSEAGAPSQAQLEPETETETETEPPSDPTDPNPAEAFAAAILQRLGPLLDLPASRVLDVAPPELCTLHPDACARMRSQPESTLAELFDVPTSEELLAYHADEPVRAALDHARQLTAWYEQIESFGSREALFVRGQAEPISIQTHLADARVEIDRTVQRCDELWSLITDYGQAISDAWARRPSDLNAAELESRIKAILWEERCARENAMLRRLDPDDAFWIHASRVMTRHVYDDSYWIPPDEATAWQTSLPLHLALER